VLLGVGSSQIYLAEKTKWLLGVGSSQVYLAEITDYLPNEFGSTNEKAKLCAIPLQELRV